MEIFHRNAAAFGEYREFFIADIADTRRKSHAVVYVYRNGGPFDQQRYVVFFAGNKPDIFTAKFLPSRHGTAHFVRMRHKRNFHYIGGIGTYAERKTEFGRIRVETRRGVKKIFGIFGAHRMIVFALGYHIESVVRFERTVQFTLDRIIIAHRLR